MMPGKKAMLYKFCFYVPLEAADQVKAAVFATGAGRIGDYDSCCWQVAGQGQFRPLAGARPAFGEMLELSFVEELKVEMVCKAEFVRAAVQAMMAAHPYEEPAYQLWQVLTIDDLGEI